MSGLSLVAAILGGLTAPLLASQLRPVVYKLLNASSETKLPFSPNELRTRDVVFVMIILAIKSFAQSLGIWSCLPVTKDESGVLSIAGPELTIEMPLEVKPDDLRKFSKAIGKGEVELSSSIGLIMLFLSSVTEPAMLLLLGKKACPIKPLGAVNVCNRFDVLDPSACLDLVNLRLPDAVVVSSLSKTVQPVKRGLQFDLRVKVLAGSERRVIFSQTFTMLEFVKHKHEVSPKSEDLSARKRSMTAGPDFSMSAKDPASWAALCKDYNPIHIIALGAKLFGLPGKIAHGNHVVARALHLLLPIDPRPGGSKSRPKASKELRKASWMTVNFKRPVTLPGTLEVHSCSVDGALQAFEIYKKGKVCIGGELGFS